MSFEGALTVYNLSWLWNDCTVMEKEKWSRIQAVMERESHSPIIHEVGSVLLAALRAMLQIHRRTFARFNVIHRQHKEPTEILHIQIFLRARAAEK